MLHVPKYLPPLRRALLSTAAAAASSSPSHFAAEDYLVATCGLTREQAAKAAKCISHWKSPSRGDAVVSFLTGPELGLSKADVAFLVAKDARILNCSVDNNLRTRVDGFRRHGFSSAQISSYVRLAPHSFRSFNIDEKFGFWISFLGSPDKLLRMLRRNTYLVTSDLNNVVQTNIKLLQESGLSTEQIKSMCLTNPRPLTNSPDNTRAILARADKIGVPRSSPLFKQAVIVAAGLAPETMASKIKMMGETLGCSVNEVATMVRRNPRVLDCSREKVQRVWEFMANVVGVDAKYILARPALLTCSLDRRLAPRHHVMKVLQEKGLISRNRDFYSMVALGDDLFYSKFVRPHEDVLPDLANAYASACKEKIDNCGNVIINPFRYPDPDVCSVDSVPGQ